MNRTHLDHRLARTGRPLVVPAVPPVPAQPGERPLHHPPPRQLHVPLRARRTTHYLDPIAGRTLHQPPLEPVVVVLRVGPEQLQPTAVLRSQAGQHLGGACPVVGGGHRDHHDQEQPQGVHDDMPLPTGDLLAPVVAPVVGDLGRLDRLAVDAPGAGARLLADGHAHHPTQGVHDLLPGAVAAPLVVVVVHRTPGRQVVGEHVPLAAAAVEVENGVEHLPHLDLAGTADGVDGNQGLDDFPLLVSQVGGVGLTHRGMSLCECVLLTSWKGNSLQEFPIPG